MDTRRKIIALEQAQSLAADHPVVWIAGHFDPLLAEHARRIQAHRRPGHLLIAVVTNPTQPYLPQSARAELVAALEFVDRVAMKPGTTDDPESDRIAGGFVAHVLDRHSGARS